MDIRKVEDSLIGIENASKQIEDRDQTLADFTGHIRKFADQIRKEMLPEDDNAERTRDQISSREWAEYEWHDVTSLGDRQRQYIRGLKR